MVRTIAPRLGPMEFVSRFTFANGALQAVYRHGVEVARMARERLGPDAVPSERDWVEQIVAFCAAGLRAQSSPCAVEQSLRPVNVSCSTRSDGGTGSLSMAQKEGKTGAASSVTRKQPTKAGKGNRKRH
jgi:hypothetical protein